MKKLAVPLIIWLIASIAIGQSLQNFSGSVTGFPIFAPDGTSFAPSYSFASHPSAGFWLDQSFYATIKSFDGVGTDQAGGATQIFPGRGTGLAAAGTVYIGECPPNAASGNTLNTCQNVALFQSTAANILLGGVAMVSGTPALNQVYGGVITAGRTDAISNGGWAFRGGQGTGTASSGSSGFSFSVAPPSINSGSSPNAYQASLILNEPDGSVVIGNVTAPTAGLSTFTGASSAAANTVGGGVTIKGGAATNGAANGGDVTIGGGNGVGGGIPGQIIITSRTFAQLGTPGNGAIAYCSDCTIANPCASGGTGALAKRLAGVWVCN